ncbi:hypothetical protein GJV06_13390 [Enterobacteriaceae bacterium RIT691]|nr:hypothetical protein [Enterobacteriaceae bacterium RIT691]
MAHPVPRVATEPAIFAQRLTIVTEAAGLSRERLLKWIVAWCGLSAAWFLENNDPISTPLSVAELAMAALEQ